MLTDREIEFGVNFFTPFAAKLSETGCKVTDTWVLRVAALAGAGDSQWTPAHSTQCGTYTMEQ